jgi:transcriptional regulator with XRE-family HTH domain
MAARLGAAAREARQAAGLRQIDIAVVAGVDETTIGRFERGQRWAWNTDDIVAAYANELRITPDDVWRLALAHP